jgi:hypothetical protein
MTATAGVFPGHEVVDRTSINAWLTLNFVRAVEATQVRASTVSISRKSREIQSRIA